MPATSKSHLAAIFTRNKKHQRFRFCVCQRFVFFKQIKVHEILFIDRGFRIDNVNKLIVQQGFPYLKDPALSETYSANPSVNQSISAPELLKVRRWVRWVNSCTSVSSRAFCQVELPAYQPKL